MASLRASSETEFKDSDELLGRPFPVMSRRPTGRFWIWTRKALSITKWVVLFSLQIALLVKAPGYLRNTVYHSGDDANDIVPKCRYPQYSLGDFANTSIVAQKITYSESLMDDYISNYTSDEDIEELRLKWRRNLLPG
jgi:hypothetical protein